MSEAYIVAAVRTAGGRRQGRLSGWHPVDLAAQVLNALVDRTGVDPSLLDDVILGCVSQAGEQSTNVARAAVLASKLPQTVPATTIDRQCGSSQQALHFAAQAVMSGTQDIVIAGGVESMSRVPMGLPHWLPKKNGYGDYISPGILVHYPNAVFSQFDGAEMLVDKYNLSKSDIDAFALASHQKAITATREGYFDNEILPVAVKTADDDSQDKPSELHRVDEGIRFDATLDSISQVKLIQEGGKISAAAASQICDGASGIMVVNERGLKALGVKPLARIHHISVLGDDPVIMLEGPIPATKRALQKTGLTLDEIDLYEVNEAFASIPMAWLQALDANPDKLNIHGGAIALGHPLGATGTKLMTTLVSALQRTQGRYGLQAVCEGGGMANVTIVERL
ncbi:acetyl-CoA C-acetyltransferase [Psychrobacter sp. FDAARGOS_221]|uniref:acetyl-CoA C-acetyltransferase n=1 Tax=Psychrobacter sp. FDAARGOS_221 TaxID=1975705 RepID=UPI000BB533FB|nr:acetyl-CoA C-acetyltransferase [Psychrobacter sp. FDAARGOS_221]PNK59822.1 acetyl-CoA C-acyltransferase [Psychrobacter sp. FDAARGOS_221]